MNFVSGVIGYLSPRGPGAGSSEVTPDDKSLPESRNGTESSEANRAPMVKSDLSLLSRRVNSDVQSKFDRYHS